MNKGITIFALTAILILSAMIFGCSKGSSDGEDGNGKLEGAGDFATFETAMGDFKELVRFVSVSPDKNMAYDLAKTAEESWGEVESNFPEDPPKKYRADNMWQDRVGELKKIMGDIKSAVSKDDFVTANSKVRDAQKLLLEMDEENKISSAGNEAIKILDLGDQVESAFKEERFEDAKHIWPKMEEAQKNFFSSPIPDSARDNQDSYDEGKDEVYDAIDEFVEAEGPENRLSQLEVLKTVTSEFWVEFG